MVNIRDASDEQKGGGYDPRMACHRALMDAFSGLFLYQSPDEVPSWQEPWWGPFLTGPESH